jgi:hypothetical protein
VSVFAFHDTVLLMCMWTQHMMGDANPGEGVEFFILISPVNLRGNNFMIKKLLNKSLEFLEDLRLVF